MDICRKWTKEGHFIKFNWVINNSPALDVTPHRFPSGYHELLMMFLSRKAHLLRYALCKSGRDCGVLPAHEQPAKKVLVLREGAFFFILTTWLVVNPFIPSPGI
jgi:hypothetical protein